MQKTRAGADSTATPVKTAPKAEVRVQASAKAVKCNRLFSDSHEQSWKPEKLKKECSKS
jgi:hypothetical protein